MRWIIAFVLLFAATVAFLIVGEFPELLKDYPRLRQISNELRETLGLEEEVCFELPPLTPGEAMELFAAEVIPQFRGGNRS